MSADFPNFQDLFRVARDEILVRNAAISRDVVEREGTDANILVASGVAAADEVVGQLTDVAAGLFLDSARGDDLDRLVFDRYGLLRKPAAPSDGIVTFSLTPAGTANPAAFTIPSGTILQTPDGIQFITTVTTTFPALSLTLQVPVRSTLAGLSQQAKAGTITSIVSAITGSPSNLVVTNALATAGADDAELDDSLRDRARAFFTTARRGTIEIGRAHV